MKIPKYIQKLLDIKSKSYAKASFAGFKIDIWLESHGIQINTCDTVYGGEAITNPYSSVASIRKAIENHQDNQ